jgi:hypothetical protein
MSVALLEIPLPPPPPTTVRTQIQLQKNRFCCRQEGGRGIKKNKWVKKGWKEYEEKEEGEAWSFSASFTAIDLIRVWCSLPPPLAPHPFTIEQRATAVRGA